MKNKTLIFILSIFSILEIYAQNSPLQYRIHGNNNPHNVFSGEIGMHISSENLSNEDIVFRISTGEISRIDSNLYRVIIPLTAQEVEISASSMKDGKEFLLETRKFKVLPELQLQIGDMLGSSNGVNHISKDQLNVILTKGFNVRFNNNNDSIQPSISTFNFGFPKDSTFRECRSHTNELTQEMKTVLFKLKREDIFYFNVTIEYNNMFQHLTFIYSLD